MSAAGLTALLATAALAASAPAAASAAGAGMLVTFAARVCPNYTDVTANRARNDIQESLRDLGADTPYKAGQAIDAAIEAHSQPNCRPLPGWAFTMGTGYKTRAVSGPWGSLSIVTGAFPTSVVTQASVPLLAPDGRPTGESLAGATTVELTPQQASLAARASSLWVQGGTPTDPILNVPFPGQYGFAALRCAIDNLNGDNVEWIGFPTGARHVLCFAYYVQPPPTSGTIIIRKVASAPVGTSESFPFDGNISFNQRGRFSITSAPGRPGEATFVRAETRPGEEPWNVREEVPPDWHLTGLECSSLKGTSTHTADAASAKATITLGAGDTVTCTYTDALVPPNGALAVRKLTQGATGSFPFTVTPVGGGTVTHASASTSEEGVAADAVPTPIALAPGGYVVAETLPAATRRGSWSSLGAVCDGASSGGTQATVTIAPSAGAVCTFTNLFTPSGAIALRKRTLGGTGTTGFVISPQSGIPFQIAQSATTTAEGVPVLARGEPSTGLDLGSYVVQETTAPPAHGGHWELVQVECGGSLLPFAAGAALVELTASHPRRPCTFTNQLVPGPIPPGPAPVPPGTVDEARLTVAKRALAATYAAGETVTYRVSVVNHGPAAADEVVVDDRPDPGARLISAHPSRGSCAAGLPLVCRLGGLAVGAHATVTVTLSSTAAALRNCAVVGSSTYDSTPAGDSACASSQRAASREPSFTG